VLDRPPWTWKSGLWGADLIALPDWTRERQAGCLVAGIDEAGRGPLAGPVVAAAVILPDPRNTQLPDGINDSKALTPARRDKIFTGIRATAIVGVGLATVDEIDQINILQATMLAMTRSVGALSQSPEFALVDGNRIPDLPCPGDAVIGGDGLCLSIAAASIIAKVIRDRIMEGLARANPSYGWERNRGYGTAEHKNAIAAGGVTCHHRRSFAPIREAIQAREESSDRLVTG
jgi:ribonuclease HII